MPFWAKYGTETTIQFPMIKRGVVDFAQSADWTPASTDVAISKDNGNYADGTNAPAIVGGSPTRGVSKFKLVVTATELQAAVVEIQIVDAATKAVEDQSLTIYTYGHASAHFKGDWSDIVRLGLTALPNAAADAAGGLPISDAGGLDLDAKLANTNEVTAARMGALTDWINGGRLDLILDIIAADTTTDIPALIAALNNLSSAQAQTAAESALQTYHLDHFIASADPGAVVANSSFLAKLVSKSGTPAFSSFDNTTDSLEALRDNVGTAGAGLTAADDAVISAIGGLNNLSSAQAQTAAEAALVTHRLDELLNADSDIDGAAPPTVGSVFHELMSKTAGSFTFDQTTDSCEAIRDRGDAAWITATGFALASVCTETRLAELDAANLPADVAAVKTDTGGLVTTVGVAGAGLSGIPKTGFKLASDGLNLIIPADPGSTKPVLGTSNFVEWQAFFGAWSINEVRSDSNSVDLRNTANGANLATHATTDTGTVFTSGAAS